MTRRNLDLLLLTRGQIESFLIQKTKLDAKQCKHLADTLTNFKPMYHHSESIYPLLSPRTAQQLRHCLPAIASTRLSAAFINQLVSKDDLRYWRGLSAQVRDTAQALNNAAVHGIPAIAKKKPRK